MTTAYDAPRAQPAGTMLAVDRRVAVLDDQRLLAESLEIALSIHGYDVRRIPVPDRPGAPSALITAIQRIRPRVLLVDLDLGGFGDGLPLLTPLARAGVRVVVLSDTDDRARWGDALVAGARTVVPKSRALNEVISVVRRANDGLPLLDAQDRDDWLAARQARLAAHGEHESRLARLSPRESEVLGLLMKGRSVRDIAADSVVSEATVRTQVKSILTKLDVSSQLAAVSIAYRSMWQPPASA